MKYLELSLALLLTITISMSAEAQAVAYIDTGEAIESVTADDSDEMRINKAALNEIATYISDRTAFPFGEFGYTSEHKVIVKVVVNQQGEVIQYDIKESSNDVIGESIMNTLSTLKKVSPVVIDGLPTTQTIEMPIIFRL